MNQDPTLTMEVTEPVVKILEGRELDMLLASAESKVTKEFYIEQNQKPLKIGRVAYLFKSSDEGIKGRGVYLFLDWTNWCDRNLRVIGLMGQSPFFTRAMTKEEAIQCHFQYRMKYHWYKDWETLLEDDAIMDVPAETIKELSAFQEKYKLPARSGQIELKLAS
jgi:hypothetical protein